MDEGHDADDDAYEAGQQGQDHACTSGIPVSCREKKWVNESVSKNQNVCMRKMYRNTTA